MSNQQEHFLAMPISDGTKRLIEGHPIGVSKIIQGDLRERTWESEGQTYTSKQEDGMLLYDSTEKRHRPWFVLVYESGRRYNN